MRESVNNMKTDPDWVDSEYNKDDDVDKLDDTTKGVDGDEKESVGFEEGIVEPESSTEERY